MILFSFSSPISLQLRHRDFPRYQRCQKTKRILNHDNSSLVLDRTIYLRRETQIRRELCCHHQDDYASFREVDDRSQHQKWTKTGSSPPPLMSKTFWKFPNLTIKKGNLTFGPEIRIASGFFSSKWSESSLFFSEEMVQIPEFLRGSRKGNIPKQFPNGSWRPQRRGNIFSITV